jgi:cell fate regulator YaaT (PSP1 superfamily)
MVVKVYCSEREQYYEAGELSLKVGAQVLVEYADRLCVGKVVGKAPFFPHHKLKEPLKAVMRLATPADVDRIRRAAEREEDTHELAVRLAETQGLPMKIVRVRVNTDGKKVTVFFTAEQRIDFRELVRDLSQRIRARVEMKQIGARDEAAITGPGLGSCGRTLCCKSWLPSFHPVTMRMAKEQKLALNSAKITGVCGRLKCCLAFEYPIYRELQKRLPKVGQPVDTSQGPGIVQAQDILRESVTVQLESGGRFQVTLDEIMHIATARLEERGGGHPYNTCGGGCGGGGCQRGGIG